MFEILGHLQYVAAEKIIMILYSLGYFFIRKVLRIFLFQRNMFSLRNKKNIYLDARVAWSNAIVTSGKVR